MQKQAASQVQGRPGHSGPWVCSHLCATGQHTGLPEASTQWRGRDRGSGEASEILQSSHLERSLQIAMKGPRLLPSLVWVLPEWQEPGYSRGRCGVGGKRPDLHWRSCFFQYSIPFLNGGSDRPHYCGVASRFKWNHADKVHCPVIGTSNIF